MIDSFDKLSEVSQEFYFIVYSGDVRGKQRLCYLQKNNNPLFFYNYQSASLYFDVNEIATVNDSLLFWKTGKITYPEAKIVKGTMTNFEVV